MLMALERMPEAGETVSLCLEFVPGGRLCTDAPVRRNGDGHDIHHHHHHQE
jgi:copper(I)-binding protein